jgi:hypothetical protein
MKKMGLSLWIIVVLLGFGPMAWNLLKNRMRDLFFGQIQIANSTFDFFVKIHTIQQKLSETTMTQ